MVRNDKRPRRGRHEFGGALPQPAPRHHSVEKIISGGQTGVDRAALDIALELGIPCGGWCPKGRRAEDGAIPPRYPLAETKTGDYRQRTLRNVQAADGTLILTRGTLGVGSALTRTLAGKLGKPCLVVDLAQNRNLRPVRAWIKTNGIGVLNVAGPRESGQSGIYAEARRFLTRMLGARKPTAQSPARRKKASTPST
ncbi:MAG: putative molybdenum carrier protein [Pseudomonadota bacterium]